MPYDDEQTDEVFEPCSSWLVTWFIRLFLTRLFRRRKSHPAVNWHETVSEALARFFVGLPIGVGLCVPLFVGLFWPGRYTGRSVWEQLGEPGWVIWLFVGVVAGSALVGALTTRVIFRGAIAASTVASEENADARVRTGCMGILMPLALAAYGAYYITHPRKAGLFGRLLDPQAVVGIGIMALGMAVFVHALGFAPYERIPLLKWIVVVAGVALFLCGLTWPHKG